MPLLRSDWDEIQHWLRHDGVDILIILLVVLVAYIVFQAIFPRIAKAAMMRGAHPPDEEMEKRANTIVGVMERTFGIVLIIIAIVTILPELGVNITAIVTGLGITGLALALGSQQLVRDTLNGIFLLAEDQYRTGDVVSIAGVTGTVESITLRRTILRDDDGVVHVVPNGSIGVVSNYTRDYAVVNVDVRVAVGEDLDRVSTIVDEVAGELQSDPATGDLFLELPKIKRMDAVGEAGVTLIVSARVRPNARWDAAAALRRRLTQAFLREGIRLPYPVIADEADEPAHS